MKKLFTAILILIYFTVSTGFVVSFHYCMDELSSAQLGVSNDGVCKKCGMKADGNCCRDEVTVVKLQMQHTVAPVIVGDFAAPAVISTVGHLLPTSLKTFYNDEYSVDHSPPPDGQDIYLKKRVFRI